MNDSQNETRIQPSPISIIGVEPKHKAYLIPYAGSGAPLAIDAPELIIGRGDGANLRLNDPHASRHHAKLLAIHNHYYVQDLGSTNGTLLNGYKVQNERIAHGDLLVIGDSVFRFEIGEDLDGNYLSKLNRETVTALAEAVDKKDSYTGSHSKAVARISARLAEQVGMDAAFVERVRIAGRLHDLGKIGVPDAVLRKPGRLDEAEFALIRQHPIDGEAILAPLLFLADVLPAVRHHHERFDGKGYPDGLAGTGICIEARIIQLADSYHAMASARTYRRVQSLDYVRQEFITHAGSQFDPELVPPFVSLLPELYGTE